MSPVSPKQKPKQKICVWSILSIIFAFLFSPLGIIFGIVALVKIKRDPSLKGKVLAIVGLVVGGFFFSLGVFVAGIGLKSLGVMNPEKFLPESCVIGPEIKCTDWVVSSDGKAEITIQNTLEEDLKEALTTTAAKPKSKK